MARPRSSRHTLQVLSRCAAVLAVAAALVVSSPLVLVSARAEPVPEPSQEADAAPAPARTSWDRLIGPHDHQIAVVLEHAETLYAQATRASRAVAPRAAARMLDDARGMLRYAARLEQDHLHVLELLAQVNEAAGRLAEAEATYQRYRQAMPPGTDIPAAHCARLGSIKARRGRPGEATAHLEQCLPALLTAQGAQPDETVEAVFLLASLYADAGRMAAATRLMQRSELQATPLLVFVLAALYDKDEQTTPAYETLSRLRSTLGYDYQESLGRSLASLPFTPAADRHYLFALLFEISGYLPEARQEWLHYLASEEPRFAGRARQHLQAISAAMRAQSAGPPASPRSGPRRPPAQPSP